MTAKLIEIIVMEGIALLMFWFAYLIGVKKKMELIAGYNKKSSQYVTDKEGLARLVGRLCLLVCTGAFGGFVAGAIGVTVLQARDYATKPSAPRKP